MHQCFPLFYCGFLKDTLSSTKDIVLIINFFSLNFTSIEIEGERVSSNQNERTLEGGGVLEKEQGQSRGGGRGLKFGNFERMYFLNVPYSY